MKYNFKKFFSNIRIANDEWVSNAHFIIRKSALKKSHNTYVSTFLYDHPKAKSLSDLANTLIKDFLGYNGVNTEFTPTLYNDEAFKKSSGKMYPAVIDNQETAFDEAYYDFIKDLNCKIIYNQKYSPAMIYNKNHEIVGVILPLRLKKSKINEAMDYNT